TEAARRQFEADNAALESHRNNLAQQDVQLKARMAEAQAVEQRIAEERHSVTQHRQELQRRLENFERENAEQLEALAKQTKRLTDRRAEVEAAEADLEKALSA